MTTPLTIRIARPQDARALAAIYRPYVEQTAISFECEAPTATSMLRRMENVLSRRTAQALWSGRYGECLLLYQGIEPSVARG